MAEIRNRITTILSRMKHDTFERDEALALSLLSALAGESIFLLGLPGVGKSMTARRLKLAFDNATVFEYHFQTTCNHTFGCSGRAEKEHIFSSHSTQQSHGYNLLLFKDSLRHPFDKLTNVLFRS